MTQIARRVAKALAAAVVPPLLALIDVTDPETVDLIKQQVALTVLVYAVPND